MFRKKILSCMAVVMSLVFGFSPMSLTFFNTSGSGGALEDFINNSPLSQYSEERAMERFEETISEFEERGYGIGIANPSPFHGDYQKEMLDERDGWEYWGGFNKGIYFYEGNGDSADEDICSTYMVPCEGGGGGGDGDGDTVWGGGGGPGGGYPEPDYEEPEPYFIGWKEAGKCREKSGTEYRVYNADKSHVWLEKIRPETVLIDQDVFYEIRVTQIYDVFVKQECLWEEEWSDGIYSSEWRDAEDKQIKWDEADHTPISYDSVEVSGSDGTARWVSKDDGKFEVQWFESGRNQRVIAQATIQPGVSRTAEDRVDVLGNATIRVR